MQEHQLRALKTRWANKITKHVLLAMKYIRDSIQFYFNAFSLLTAIYLASNGKLPFMWESLLMFHFVEWWRPATGHAHLLQPSNWVAHHFVIKRWHNLRSSGGKMSVTLTWIPRNLEKTYISAAPGVPLVWLACSSDILPTKRSSKFLAAACLASFLDRPVPVATKSLFRNTLYRNTGSWMAPSIWRSSYLGVIPRLHNNSCRTETGVLLFIPPPPFTSEL